MDVDLETALLLRRVFRSTTSPTPSGLLFATGLYAIYQQRGADFVPDYMNLLASTGEAPAADLATALRYRHPTRKLLGGQPQDLRKARRSLLRDRLVMFNREAAASRFF